MVMVVTQKKHHLVTVFQEPAEIGSCKTFCNVGLILSQLPRSPAAVNVGISVILKISRCGEPTRLAGSQVPNATLHSAVLHAA